MLMIIIKTGSSSHKIYNIVKGNVLNNGYFDVMT